MLFVIETQLQLDDIDRAGLLSNMVYVASGVVDSSHLGFFILYEEGPTSIWHLPDTKFNRALSGVAFVKVLPYIQQQSVVDLTHVKYFKEEGARFATRSVQLFGGVDPDSFNVYTLDQKYHVFIGTSTVDIDIETLIKNLEEV